MNDQNDKGCFSSKGITLQQQAMSFLSEALNNGFWSRTKAQDLVRQMLDAKWEQGSSVETRERLPNLVARLRRINAINDNPARYDSEIDKLTECGKFIAPDEYCELTIGHEGRCGLLPGTQRRQVETEALWPGCKSNDTGYHRPNTDGECSDCGAKRPENGTALP